MKILRFYVMETINISTKFLENFRLRRPKLFKNLILGRVRAFGSLIVFRPSADFTPPPWSRSGKSKGEFLKGGFSRNLVDVYLCTTHGREHQVGLGLEGIVLAALFHSVSSSNFSTMAWRCCIQIHYALSEAIINKEILQCGLDP